MRNRPQKQVLEAALAHLQFVTHYGEGDLTEQKTVDAICMRLSAGIEALSGLDEGEREALFGDV